MIAFECSALLAVAFGTRAVITFMIAGVVFHIAAAAQMRLNHFVWAFAASYPGMLHLAAAMERDRTG